MMARYLFSSPYGDIPVGQDDCERPFLISLSDPHPFLTLGDYFGAIEKFISEDNGFRLIGALQGAGGKGIDISRIESILIRSEKHGVLYHIASIELLADNNALKFALSTALSAKARQCLEKEFELISHLNNKMKPGYLPISHYMGDIVLEKGNRTETLCMALMEWFEDYHEWHLSIDARDQTQKVCVWDQNKGDLFLTARESSEIFMQASRILTLYYDTHTYRIIRPWHHAAGDFIVKMDEKGIDLRLTTARGYESLILFMEEEAINPLAGLVFFFLDLTVRMRLDRLEGLGEPIWADDLALDATIRGFFQGIGEKESQGLLEEGSAAKLLDILREFNKEELQRLLNPLMMYYRQEDNFYYGVIEENLSAHIRELSSRVKDLDI